MLFSAPFCVGNKVRVTSGSFRGNTGTVIKVSFLGIQVQFDSPSYKDCPLWLGPEELEEVR